MELHLPIIQNAILPTGKSHISFSEYITWENCSHQHKLTYVDKLNSFTGNENTIFGHHVHHGCEMYVKNRLIPIDDITDLISDSWNENGYLDKDLWIAQAKNILAEVPDWMDNTFLDWELIDAEHKLFEPLTDAQHPDIMWKGYVDAAITFTYGKRKRRVVQLIDWKTTVWGWRAAKMRDFKVQAQLASYKIFWHKKYDVKLTDIKTGFVLLKRTAKTGNHCQLIDISVGQKIIDQLNNNVDIMLRSLKTGSKQFKNKTACFFCDYNGTEHCDGDGGWRWG